MIKNRQFLLKKFDPEFLNRIDDVVIFNTLSKDHIFAIIDIFKKQLINPTKQKRVFFLHLYGSHNDACK